MAEELTQEQLLLLDNLMYVKDITYLENYSFIGVYEAWKDNFEGMYETDTEAQLMAKEYVD